MAAVVGAAAVVDGASAVVDWASAGVDGGAAGAAVDGLIVVLAVAAAVDGLSNTFLQTASVTQKNGWTVMQMVFSSFFMVKRVGLVLNSPRQVRRPFA